MGICSNFQAPGGRLSYPLKDKSPPCPGRGGVGLCIDRCIKRGRVSYSSVVPGTAVVRVQTRSMMYMYTLLRVVCHCG